MRVASKETNFVSAKFYPSAIEKEPDWALVKQYLPLLKSIVNKVLANTPPTIDRESFYTLGLLGLISASKTYNKKTYSAFGRYAAIKIRGALLDEFRHLDWLSRGLRKKTKVFKQKLEALQQNLGRTPSNEEICNYLHLTKQEVEKLKSLLTPQFFIPIEIVNDPTDSKHEPKSLGLAEKLADVNQITGREICEINEIKALLMSYLQEMPKLVQQVFTLHYVEGLFFSEIARIFNLSESRVCQLHTRTLLKLRRKLQKLL
jgi:RNA polymerase sigma factor for flagellar operon FliA